MQKIKCVVGDCAVGKTSLLIRHSRNEFFDCNNPTVLDHYSANDMVLVLSWMFWDTSGHKDYDRLRPLSYPGTDVVLICFSVVEPTSVANTQDKWYPEIEHHIPTIPLILVGTQVDLREDTKTINRLAKQTLAPITVAQGEKKAKKLNAYAYMECSALTQKGVTKVFEGVILAVRSRIKFIHPPSKKSACALF